MLKKKIIKSLFFVILLFVWNGVLSFENKELNEKTEVRQEGKPQAAPERILVKYRRQPNISTQKAVKTSIESSYGIQSIRHFSFIDVFLYKVYWDKEKTLNELNKNPNIEYAEPDYQVYLDSTFPNDPLFNNLWGLNNTGQTGGTLDADIDAPEAWDLATGSNNVVVAVIDTGVDYNHEDLNTNMWTNPDEIPDDGIDNDENEYVDDYYGINAITDSGDPMDDHYHGTHVSGTVAAVGNNGIGVVGVCWTAKIMALKFLDSSGYGWTSDAVKCIEYAIDKGAHIMSNSWGGGGFSQTLRDAIEAAKNANILFVAAAGNAGTNNDEYPHYPSNYDNNNVIAVSATTHLDNQYYNYGPYSVDVAAPGTSIYSTMPDNSYGYLSGTSMATPHVAGLAALIRAYYSSSSEKQIYAAPTWQQIKNRILSNVDQLASLQGKVLTGGRINAYKSLTSGDVSSYSLDIQSTPAAGTYIEVSPNDLNGQGDGNTNFTRSYIPYSEVTLTAPDTHSGRKFGFWTLEGTRYSFNRSITVEMDFNHTAAAVYPLWTLKVESSPDTNIFINVSPLDENGEGDGNTNFTRKYHHGTTVSLTAPAEHDGKKFITWLKDGKSYDSNLNSTVNTNDDYTLTAYYSDKMNWRFNTNSSLVNYSSPAIGLDGTIYFGAGTNIFALNPDGSEKWRFNTQDNIYTSPAIGSDGILYCLTYSRLYALYPDGTKKWDYSPGGVFSHSSPAIGSDGTLYFGSLVTNELYAVDKSGIFKWKFLTGGYIYSSPAVDLDGTIYFSCTDGKIYALYPNGTKKWEFVSPVSEDWITAPPAIGSDGTIYVGGWSIVFYAINPDGTLKWTFPPWRTFSESNSGTLERMEGPTGGFGSMWASTAIDTFGSNDVIYIPTWSGVYAVYPDSSEKWYFHIGYGGYDWVFSSPVIDTDGNIYFGDDNGKFYALDPDGTKKWEFITGDEIYVSSAAISADGILYFGSGDGYLYALKSDSLGLNNSIWPKFHRDNRNTGRIPSSLDLPPWVSITSPSNGDQSKGIVNVEATASDDVQVTKVEFYIDDQLKQTDTSVPYGYGWDTTSYAYGSHKIKAVAYDSIGQTNEEEISVTVDQPPAVNVTSPSNGDTLSGTVLVQATATDDDVVAKVEFYLDDLLKHSTDTAPYFYSWDTTAYTNGTHKVKAISTDSSGQTSEHEISVYVDQPPSVTITSPSDGDQVLGIVNVEATASDDVQVTKVEFYIDDQLKQTDTSSPYSYGWDTTSYAYGSHKIKTVAYDSIGQTNEEEISVTVDNPPSVSISSHSNGDTLSGIVNIQASASDDDQVNKVEFYIDNQLKHTDTTSPYSYSWDTNSINNKDYTLKAFAYDSAQQTKEDQINLTVLPHSPFEFSGEKVLNRSLSQAEYINVLTWEVNPYNVDILKYRIYSINGANQITDLNKRSLNKLRSNNLRIKGNKGRINQRRGKTKNLLKKENNTLLIELNTDIFEYWQRKVAKNKQYDFAICAVDSQNRESEFTYIQIK